MVSPVVETEFQSMASPRPRDAVAEGVAGLGAQAVARKTHRDGRPGAAAEIDLRKGAQVLGQSGDTQGLVPAHPDTGIGERVHVPVDAGGEVIEEPRAEYIIVVHAPGLAGDGLQLEA